MNGYVGLRINVFKRAALPPGTQAFLVLTERVPASREGSPFPRQVMHGVAGPISLAGLATRRELVRWFAMALPETAQGEVIAEGQSNTTDCTDCTDCTD